MARRFALALAAVAAIAAGCGGAAKDHAGATTAARGELPTAGGRSRHPVVSRQRLGARLEDWTLQTPALRDPTRVRVLLPAGYGSTPGPPLSRALPAARADSDYRSWTRYGDAQAITAHAADDRRDARWRRGPGGTRTGTGAPDRCSRGGRPTTSGELVPWVDATYRTIAARRGGRSPGCRWAATVP
jgi:hypothetical protein